MNLDKYSPSRKVFFERKEGGRKEGRGGEKKRKRLSSQIKTG